MEESTTVRRHWWVAVLLGLAAPGAGQLYTGRARLAAYIVGVFAALFALFWTAIPSSFAGFVAAFGAPILLAWGSAIEASIYAWRHSEVPRRSYHCWYVYVGFVLAFTLVSQGANRGLLTVIGEPSLFGAYKPYRATSGSLEPSLMEGEYFWVKTARGATQSDLAGQLGSIVVVSWPQEGEGAFIYRLIAVGGQTVAVIERKVLVDGREIPQRVLCSVPEADSGELARRSVETVGGRSYVVQNFDSVEFSRNTDEATVPDDWFFVIGDNRENANDSRTRGPVSNDNFGGRALFIIWSGDWHRIGKTLVPTAAIEASDYCPPVTK